MNKYDFIIQDKKTRIKHGFEFIEAYLSKDILPTVSEWAEKDRVLTSKTSKKTGPFEFDYAPYTREIADRFSKNDPCREVAVMKGTQLCISAAVLENTIGYNIAHNPCPMMYISADKQLIKKFKKVKIDPMIDNSGLRDKIVAETGNRNSRRQGDTAEMLEYAGGFLILTGPNNANDLRMFSIRDLLLDELDAYPEEVGNDGDPVELASARTEGYSEVKKIGYVSTPLIAHTSRINKLYKKGDQRKYFVPCPHCGEMQELVFFERDGGSYHDKKGIRKDGVLTKPYGLFFDSKACKDGDYSSVRYKCKYCGEDSYDYHKHNMQLSGKWIATAKSKVPFFHSYHISGLYNPAKPWWEGVKMFLEAGTDPRKLQVFYNNFLGLPFEDTTAGVEINVVSRRRDENLHKNELPKGALFLTGACDVQDDRLEVEIKAWGNRWRSWGLDHRIIYGDTSDSNDPCWQELLAIKDEKWGGKSISYLLIDSGDGEKTDLVYNLCSCYGEGQIFPLKGFNASVKTSQKFKILPLENYNSALVEAYVDQYKNQLSRWLNQEWRENEDYPDGWITFANEYSDEYLRQLTTEKKVKKTTAGGLITVQWVQHGRNESFDLNVYNLCAAEIFVQTYSKNFLQLDYTDAKAVFEDLMNGE